MNQKEQDISLFQRYLSLWVLLCMVAGVLIGRFIPVFPVILGKMQIAGISIPMAALIWVMIYPMIKVDFKSIREAGKNPKGLFITWITNWLINPFRMYGIASFFLFVIFKGGSLHLNWPRSILPERYCSELPPPAQTWFLSGVN